MQRYKKNLIILHLAGKMHSHARFSWAGHDFSVDGYAIGVSNEILWALKDSPPEVMVGCLTGGFDRGYKKRGCAGTPSFCVLWTSVYSSGA